MTRSGNQPDFNQRPTEKFGEGNPIWEFTKEIAVAMQGGKVDLADVSIESARLEELELFVIKAVVGLPIPGVKPSSIASPSAEDPVGEPIVLHIKFKGDSPTRDNLAAIKIIVPDPFNPASILFTEELIRNRGEELHDIESRVRQAFLEYIRKPRRPQMTGEA